ncbi:probable LRR receptor-like serine/threonine-protein kinase, partial [Tanacetum coccineum]
EAPQRLLDLRQRLKIATDVAHAIHYLHQDCEVPIIHCDLKPSNILLDNDMVAHIGDFGLAKFLPLKPHESSSIGLRGTIGYAAPEYGLGSEMTKEGDIYSFGILLLEMMTGKRPTDQMFQEGLNLHSYVQMAFPDHVMEIVEPSLLSAYEEAANRNYRRRVDDTNRRERLEDGMISLARIGLTCSKESPKDRMEISSIVHELHNINGVFDFN